MSRLVKLGALLVVARRVTAWLPVLLLFHGQIPHKPGVAAVFGQRWRLLTGGKQPKPAHNNNIGPTTDNQPRGKKRRLLPRLKPEHLIGKYLVTG